jgi:CheY-like chemotaxis protein
LADWLAFEGFQVIVSEDGADGIRLAKYHQPDLILCDVNMPLMDGLEVLRQLHNDVHTAHIPFFFLTAETKMKSDDVQQLGAKGLILKSLELDELSRVIHMINSPVSAQASS